MHFEQKKIEKKEDERGWFSEILRADDLSENDRKRFGQFGITAAKEGIVKGNHYHKRKLEWYCVIKGKALIVLEDNETGERKEIILDEKSPELLKIFPNTSHAIKNIGKGIMLLLIYTNEPFNKEDPDTYKSEIKI